MELSLAESLKRRFEAQHPGILVRLKRSGAERIFERIDPEGEAQLRDVDVICTSDAGHFVHWKREGRLTKYVPDQVANHLPPEQVDPDGMFATVFGVLSVIGYNSRLVSSNRAPKRFLDLLNPEWKGKIVKARPDYSGIVLVATFQIVQALGWSYLEQLATQNVTQVNSAVDPPNELARGEFAIQADGAVSNLLLLKSVAPPWRLCIPWKALLRSQRQAPFLKARLTPARPVYFKTFCSVPKHSSCLSSKEAYTRFIISRKRYRDAPPCGLLSFSNPTQQRWSRKGTPLSNDIPRFSETLDGIPMNLIVMAQCVHEQRERGR